MTQYVINIGAIPNDGTGDPLRTAFNETNLNFDQVFTAGPVLSNVQIANNKILTLNINGNLVLAPNGTGIVQSNVSILPNSANLRDLGSATQRWRTVYTQYLDLSGVLTIGDLIVDGNLTVQGNTIQIGNIVTDTKTIQLANTASNASSANGSGITVGVNDNIATMLYSSTSNTWTTNIGLSSVGNITAPYFFGNGSQLTGLPATYGNANVVTLLAGFGSNTVSTSGNITGGFIFGNISQANGFPATYGNSNVTTLLSAFGSNTISGTGNITTTANISGGFILGNVAFANGISTYGNANVVANLVALGSNPVSTTGNITAGNLNSPTLNNSGNIRVVASGNTWTFGANGNLTIPGNIVGSGNILIAPNSASASSYLDIYLTGGPDIHIASNDNSIVIGRDTGANVFVGNDGEVSIRTDNGATAQVWNFTDTGNLTLPGNTFSVNYANGDPVTFTANTGNVTFSGETVIGTGTSNTQSGLYLAPDPVSLANDLYLRVRGNILDEPTHIHFDTGNNQYYNQFIGDDNKYVQLANTGNIVINTSDYVGNTAQWSFNTNGTTQFPGNILAAPAGNPLVIKTTSGNVYSTLNTGALGGYTSIGIQDDSTGAYQGWAYVKTNMANVNTPSATVVVKPGNTGAEVTWTLDAVGNTTFPNGAVFTGYDLYAAANSYVELAGDTGNTYMGVGNTSVFIQTDWNGAQRQWDFLANGVMTAPGAISAVGNVTGGNLVTSGSGGNITMTGGNITGAGNIAAGNVSTTGNIISGNVNTGKITLTNGTVIKDTTGDAIAIGLNAGQTTQGTRAVAFGNDSGANSQGTYGVAIGWTAGNDQQKSSAVAVGALAGQTLQGNAAVAIGLGAGGTSQGNAAIAIGYSAGATNQANNSIILNATGSALNQTTANTFTVAPIRNDVANTGQVVFYNTSSKEVTYGNTISVAGNVTAANFFGNGATLSNVATTFESTWTVPVGNSTQSFTVTPNNTYYMWVDCNITNGILTWNATATVTNNNVPVVGAQYAWVYNGGGTPIDFTSIPDQFTGTANTIVRSSVAPSATTNRFDFGINNTSGNSQTVRYGWAQIS